MPEHDEMAIALRNAGYRLTLPRLAVLQVLQQSQEQLNPMDIYERGRAIYSRLGLVTVYRTLDILNELGIARRVHTQGDCHGFARAQDERHYLICRRCHRVVDFPCDGLESLINQVQQLTGYRIDAHLVELTGLCPVCQAE